MSSLLSTSVVLFPLWMGLWFQGPLLHDQLNCPGRIFIRPEQLQLLADSCGRVDDRYRLVLMTELAAAPVPAGQELFLKVLKTEKNPGNRATMISLLPGIGLGDMDMSSFLQDKDISVQAAALRICGRQKQVPADAIRRFLFADSQNGEEAISPVLRREAWKILASGRCRPMMDWQAMEKIRREPEEDLRALGLQAACLIQPRPAGVSEWLDQALQESPVMRAAAAADPYPDRKSRLRTLAGDPLPAVRCRLCTPDHGKFKEVILSLLGDRTASVRAAAVSCLAGYEDITEDDFARVAEAMGDWDMTVRQAAEEASARLLKKNLRLCLPVVLEFLTNAQTDGNCQTGLFRISGQLRLKETIGPATEVLQRGDASPELLSAALHLLSVTAPENHANAQVLALASHRSPMVRAAVAENCGLLKQRNSVRVLKNLVSQKEPVAVQEAAYLAMGRNPRPEFAGDLLNCLKQVEKTSVRSRVNAAWAAGHLKYSSATGAVHVNLARRLVVQCTVPVIPGLSPAFDAEEVMINAMISLAVMKKNLGPEFSSFYDQIQKIYLVRPDTANQKSLMRDGYPRSHLSYDVNRQIGQFLAGQKMSATEAPGSLMEFSLSPVIPEQGGY